MRIILERQNQAVHLQAVNEDGAIIDIDGAPSIGGENKGFLTDIRILIDGNREKDKTPSLFEDIHVHFILSGDLDEKKVKRAIDLSMNTYCSVSKIMEKTARITYSYEIKAT
jgi:uncharacterized OsmC-like protein